jgi:hypothetical protein
MAGHSDLDDWCDPPAVGQILLPAIDVDRRLIDTREDEAVTNVQRAVAMLFAEVYWIEDVEGGNTCPDVGIEVKRMRPGNVGQDG